MTTFQTPPAGSDPQPTVSTTGAVGFWTPIRIARITILLALSAVGALIKIPSPIGTVALDSAAGYLAGASFAPAEGAIVGILGYLITSATAVFPMGPFLTPIIAIEMALIMWCFAVLTRRVNVWVGGVVAVILNGVVAPATLIPFYGYGMAVSLLVPLSVASAINVIIAVAVSFALSAAGLNDHSSTTKKPTREPWRRA